MILNFTKIILHNFGSYGHAELDLANRGFCAVSGKNNFKKDNAISNGSGKSFIWSGICFAITGETIQGLHNNLKNINIEEDSCYVSVYFTCDKDEYIVTRHIEPKSDLKIIRNNEDVSGKGLRESEKKLGELLPDLTKDLIASSILLGQGMPNKFSSFSPSGRKDLLEKLTKSDFMIEDIKTRVANRLNEVDKQVRACEDSLLINSTKLNSIRTNLEALIKERETAVCPDFKAEIERSDKLLKDIDQDIKAATKNRDDTNTKLEAANKSLIELSQEKTAALTALSESYHTALDPVRQEKLETEASIRALTNEVAKLKAIKDVCPTCGQKLPGAVKPDTSTQEAEIKKLTESLAPLTARIKDVDQKNDAYKNSVIQKYADEELRLNNEIRQLRKERDGYIDRINDNTQNYNTEKENYNRLVFERDNYDKYWAKLKSDIAELQAAETQLGNLVSLTDTNKFELLERQAVLKKMDTLTKRDFRGYILVNIINYIDTRAKDYSEIVFGTRDLNVYLDSNTLDISYCGKLIDCLSGGEKQRVDLILQLALRDLLCKYFNFSSNILVLDEITDFLDKKACDAVMTLLNTTLQDVESVFIISHHTDELNIPIDSEIKIVKDENGISSIS